MSITVCTGKLHGASVTNANLDYEGSITIDPLLMRAAGISPFQLVHINNKSNAVHWETYAIPGTLNSGEICLNGCPARLFQIGDKIVILALEVLEKNEALDISQKVIHLDGKNKILKVELKKFKRCDS